MEIENGNRNQLVGNDELFPGQSWGWDGFDDRKKNGCYSDNPKIKIIGE